MGFPPLVSCGSPGKITKTQRKGIKVDDDPVARQGSLRQANSECEARARKNPVTSRAEPKGFLRTLTKQIFKKRGPQDSESQGEQTTHENN